MLEYVALGFLIFIAASLLFGAIVIIEIPYHIAVDRNHPQQDAIRHAGWVSLFTLHAIWPLLWIWAAAYREDLVPKFRQFDEDTAINDKPEEAGADDRMDTDITDSVTLLGHRYDVLDDRIDRIERAIMGARQAS